jgi:predicted Zn finger-like uncharacterized protein
MALATSCPQCQAKYNVDDNLAGKTIRCKKCEYAFVVDEEAGPRSASSRRTGQEIRERPSAASKSAISRRRSADEVYEGDGIRRPRPDEGNRDSRSRPKKKSKVGMIVGLSVGGGLLLIGGGILLFFLLMPSEVDSKLSDLKAEDSGKRDEALTWLMEADTNVSAAQRGRAAKALEIMVIEGNMSLNDEKLLRAYLHWADKDSVPTMISMVENQNYPLPSAVKTGMVMEALGRLQDERGIECLTKKLPDFQLRNAAASALKLMGDKAQKDVLPYLFHEDANVRKEARLVLESYGTKTETFATEAQRRLKSDQPGLQRTALVWFAENSPADEKTRADMAKLLVKFLDDFNNNVRTNALHALKRWATKESLPKLLEFAKREQTAPFGNQLLIEVLVQFRDETAAEAIALQLPNWHQRANAKRALLGMGEHAITAVLHYLNHPDFGLRGEVQEMCQQLKISANQYLEQTLADIASDDTNRRKVALQFLAKFEPGERVRRKVSKALNAPLLDKDPGVRGDALNAAKVWGSKENTATLLKLLEGNPLEKKPFGRDANVIEVLGIIKDPEAAPAVAKGLANFFERGHAVKALKNMGSGAEEAVQPYLLARDGGVRAEACKILAVIGTAKSVNPLTMAAQAFFRDGGFVMECKKAILEIQGRNKS